MDYFFQKTLHKLMTSALIANPQAITTQCVYERYVIRSNVRVTLRYGTSSRLCGNVFTWCKVALVDVLRPLHQNASRLASVQTHNQPNLDVTWYKFGSDVAQYGPHP